MPDDSCCTCTFVPLCLDTERTLYGVASTPKLMVRSYFFISSVISISKSIFPFLFYFCSSFICSFSFCIGVLELEIFSSLFSIWNEDFLTLLSISEAGSASPAGSAPFSPSMSSISHLVFFSLLGLLLASWAASSRICYRWERRAGWVGLWV